MDERHRHLHSVYSGRRGGVPPYVQGEACGDVTNKLPTHESWTRGIGIGICVVFIQGGEEVCLRMCKEKLATM